MPELNLEWTPHPEIPHVIHARYDGGGGREFLAAVELNRGAGQWDAALYRHNEVYGSWEGFRTRQEAMDAAAQGLTDILANP